MHTKTFDGVAARAAREALGLSVAALAKKAAISEDYLYKLEGGRRQPAPETAGRIATALGKDIEALTHAKLRASA